MIIKRKLKYEDENLNISASGCTVEEFVEDLLGEVGCILRNIVLENPAALTPKALELAEVWKIKMGIR